MRRTRSATLNGSEKRAYLKVDARAKLPYIELADIGEVTFPAKAPAMTRN